MRPVVVCSLTIICTIRVIVYDIGSYCTYVFFGVSVCKTRRVSIYIETVVLGKCFKRFMGKTASSFLARTSVAPNSDAFNFPQLHTVNKSLRYARSVSVCRFRLFKI